MVAKTASRRARSVAVGAVHLLERLAHLLDGDLAGQQARAQEPGQPVRAARDQDRLPAEGGELVLEWTPQRLVDRALLVSALAILVVVALALRPAPAAMTRSSAAAPTLIDVPVRGRRRVGRPAWPVIAAAGLFALVNLPTWEWSAVLVAAVVAVSLTRTEGARLPAGLAAGLFAITSLLIMVEQALERHPPDFIWPQQFDRFHVLGVATILLLAADYLRGLVAGDDT